jgi:hypothetical protein
MAASVLPFPSPPGRPDQEMPGPSAGSYKPLTTLKRQFTNAVSTKTSENLESAEAERYYHSVQWTDSELKILKERNQAPVTFNRVARKINVVCGILERMRQDPKAYARNPQQAPEDGAELATKVLLYALGWQWSDLSAMVVRRCAIRGISGVEMVLTQGDRQDPEIELDEVDQRDFFYDPRSVKHDFRDARYMGTSRWVDIDEAQHLWPDYAEELASWTERGAQGDWERGDERHKISWWHKEEKRCRIVDHWYMQGDEWNYSIYCGETILEEGVSPFVNEKGKSTSKFLMMSAEVDQDGDRYGWNRNLKSPQDEINHRRSKALHALNARQVIAEDGAVDDIELARRELARVDGYVKVNGPDRRFEIQDQRNVQVATANVELLTEAKAEIDTFGPNPGLVGSEIPAESGRAIQLLQAAGIAELGVFMQNYRHWKLRVYRAVWCAVQRFWTEERWIRVTDDEAMAEFIQVNGLQRDQYGFPQVINQLSSLDVDMIIDEGPDTINTAADTFDLIVAMAKGGMQIPPPIMIELSNLPSSMKKRLMEMMKVEQDPIEQQATQIKLAQETAKVGEIESKAQLNQMKAMEIMHKPLDDGGGPAPQIDTAADLAKARLDQAKAMQIEQQIAQPEAPDPSLFELNMAKVQRERAAAFREEAQAGVAHAQQRAIGAQVEKTLREARTIDEAPDGMLTRPPPRPPPGKGSA